MRSVIAAALIAISAQADASAVMTKTVSGTFVGPNAKIQGFDTRLGRLVGGSRQLHFKSEYSVQYGADLPTAPFIVVEFATTGLAADGIPQFMQDWTYPRSEDFQQFTSEFTFAGALHPVLDLPAFIGDELTFTINLERAYIVSRGRATPLPVRDAKYIGSYFIRYDYEVGSVPEPAAWAMMTGGFGMLGAAARRRRKSSSAPRGQNC